MAIDPQTRPVLPALTSLRFVGAFAVLAFHASAFFAFAGVRGVVVRLTSAGPTGVSFFFVLSGFVLTWSRRTGEPRGLFYRRRVARIYPVHLLTWAAAGVLVLLLGVHQTPAGVGLSAVLLQAWVPTRDVYNSMDAPSWSLSCEALFYALFPVLVVALERRTTSRLRVLAGALLVLAVVLTASGPHVERALHLGTGYFPEFFPPARLVEFVLGILLALEVERGTLPRLRPLPVMALAGGAFLLVSNLPTSRLYIVITLVPYLLLIGATAQADLSGDRALRWLRRPWPIRLGQWSLGLYLVHGLVVLVVLHAAQGHRVGTTGALALTGLTVGVSLALSALMFLTYERPLERLLRPRHELAAALLPVGSPAEPVGPHAEVAP